MAATKEEIIEALKEMTLLEASELVKMIEEEFGVSIAPTGVPREEMNTVNLIIHQVEIRL